MVQLYSWPLKQNWQDRSTTCFSIHMLQYGHWVFFWKFSPLNHFSFFQILIWHTIWGLIQLIAPVSEQIHNGTRGHKSYTDYPWMLGQTRAGFLQIGRFLMETNQACGVRWRFGKAPALVPDVMVEHGAGEHPDPRAGNIPAFLTSDIASVAPVNSVCVRWKMSSSREESS